MPASPFQIFIAYSREDKDFLEALRKHLRPLERSRKVKIWYDGKIEPGAVWEEAIKENLHAADIILLLVSSDSIDSDYFYEKEVADALERHHRGEAKVVPLIVRPCVWKSTPLAYLQALPKDGRAVSTWPDRDEAYSYSVEALLAMIENIEEARRQEIERAKKAEADRLTAIHYNEEQARQQEADRLAAIQLAEQQKAQAELAARQKEEQRQKAAATAAQKKKDEAARQETAEQERLRTEAEQRQKAADEQRKREAAAKRRRDNPSLFQKFYQQMIGASSILLVAAFLIWRWGCKPEETVSKLLMPTGGDSTILGQDTQVGVRTISPEQLPKDVTVEQPKKKQSSGSTISPKSAPPDTTKAKNFEDEELKKYMVLGGSFSTKTGAEAQAEKIRKMGFENVRVEIFNRGKFAVVCIDSFDTMEEAEQLSKKLTEKNVINIIKAQQGQ